MCFNSLEENNTRVPIGIPRHLKENETLVLPTNLHIAAHSPRYVNWGGGA